MQETTPGLRRQSLISPVFLLPMSSARYPRYLQTWQVFDFFSFTQTAPPLIHLASFLPPHLEEFHSLLSIKTGRKFESRSKSLRKRGLAQRETQREADGVWVGTDWRLQTLASFRAADGSVRSTTHGHICRPTCRQAPLYLPLLEGGQRGRGRRRREERGRRREDLPVS